MNYDRLIDKNDKISNDLKELTKECFSAIWDELAEKCFTRWVHDKTVSQEVQKIIIDFMTEEQKEERPRSGGFSVNKPFDPEIRIKDNKDNDVKRVQIHELYHFFTRDAKRFNVYLNEGLTEYMAQNTLEKGEARYVSYLENVEMVKFLHNILGDSLIKAYLLGKDKSFDEKFLDIIDIDNKQEELESFYNTLSKRHKLLYPIDKTEILVAQEKQEERKKELAANTQEVKKMVKKIVLGKVNQKARNLEFIQDGKFMDLNYIDDLINEIPSAFKLDSTELIELRTEAVSIIIKNSHLLVGLNKEEQKSKLDDIIFNKLQLNQSEKIDYDKELQELNEEEKGNISKIFELSFKGKENISIIDFVDKTLNIVQHYNVAQRELKSLIAQYTIEVFKGNVDIPLIYDLVQNNIQNYEESYKMEEQRKRDTIDSKYRKIADNAYIEQRDNQNFYIQVEKDGKISEINLQRNLDFINGIRVERLNDERFDKIVRDIHLEEGDKKRKIYKAGELYFSIRDGLEDVKVHNQPDTYIDYGIMSLKDLRTDMLVSPILEQISLKDYYEINNDAPNPFLVEGVYSTKDIDLRSRKLKISELKVDIKKISKIIQNDSRGEKIQKNLIEQILDNIYETKKIQGDNGLYERGQNEQQAYQDIINAILLDKESGNKVQEAQQVLNDSRKIRVEKNKGKALLFFENDKIMHKYYEEKQKIEYLEKIRKIGKIKVDLDKRKHSNFKIL